MFAGGRTMSSQAWIGIGGAAFGIGLLLLAIWRGFTISRISLFGTLELNLPSPIGVSPQRRTLLPALVMLIVGTAAIGIGFYYNLFPVQQSVAITATRSVQDNGQTTSQTSFKAVNVTFVNKTAQPVKLYWIDFDGGEVYNSSIAPSSSANVDTYAGHLWVVKTDSGVELLRYVARAS